MTPSAPNDQPPSPPAPCSAPGADPKGAPPNATPKAGPRMDFEDPVDFYIARMRRPGVHDTQPAFFDLLIEERILRLTAAQLLSPRRFRRRFFEVFHRIPDVPLREEEWLDLVNVWLAMVPELPEAPPPRSLTPCPAEPPMADPEPDPVPAVVSARMPVSTRDAQESGSREGGASHA